MPAGRRRARQRRATRAAGTAGPVTLADSNSRNSGSGLSDNARASGGLTRSGHARVRARRVIPSRANLVAQVRLRVDERHEPPWSAAWWVSKELRTLIEFTQALCEHMQVDMWGCVTGKLALQHKCKSGKCGERSMRAIGAIGCWKVV